jgi:uncharacterized protein YndB with AHSA1/START domain
MTAAAKARTTTVTLPTDRTILITREFDAPRHLLFKAWTTPELVKRWWPAGQGEASAVEIDLRVGGAWRYEMRTNDGAEVAFHGEYLEVVPDERLVSTELNDSTPHLTALRTVTFVEEGASTAMRVTIELESKDHRDLYLSWMGDGLQMAVALFEKTVLSLMHPDRR